MSIIKPFRALRPIQQKAVRVSCVPYDVIHESEARDVIRDNPESFLRVTRPEAVFPDGEKPSPDAVLERAGENLRQYIDEGIFNVEGESCVYVYRLIGETHTQTGVVAGCSLDEYEKGLIKKHEKTRPDKVEDRTNHILAVGAQTGLIFLAFRGTDKISELIAQAVDTEPLYDFQCEGSVRHTFWKIADTQKWIEAFADVPALYVADGHHRVESANLARKKLRDANPDHTGDEEYNFVMAGVFPAEDLSIMAYNRVVNDLNGLTDDEFLAHVSESFIVSETTEKVPQNHGEFCIYLSSKWYHLRFAMNYVREPDVIERLDVSILQDHLLAPILAIGDPRTDTRIAFVGGKRGTAELEMLVDTGKARVAFSLFPTTMNDLLAVSDMNEIMPPKSTWFEPKLRDGLLVHLI